MTTLTSKTQTTTTRAPLVAIRARGSVRGAAAEIARVIVTVWPAWCLALLLVHLIYGSPSFGTAMHVGTAIPGMLVIREAHRTLTKSEQGQLPFLLVGLAQYYVFLCAGVFRDRPFITLFGPYRFSEHSKVEAAIAIALGGILFAAMRPIGVAVGERVQRAWLPLLPPATPPASFRRAALVYTAFAILVTGAIAVANFLVPALYEVAYIMVSIPFASGIWFAIAANNPTRGMRRGILLIPIFGGGVSLLSGFLETALRSLMLYAASTWTYWRRIPVVLVGVSIAFYFLFNPVKFEYRARYWADDSTADTSVAARFTSWGQAFVKVWIDGERSQDESVESSADRLSEIGQVLYVFDIVPRIVPFTNGSTWLQIVTSPIPRLLWPSKPDTRAMTQSYRYVAALTPERVQASFVLPLLVDGYWNFGWFGIVIAAALVGLYLTAAERVFTPRHWALMAAGSVHLALLTSYNHLGWTYAQLFQMIAGHTILAWALYALCRLIPAPKRH